MRVHVISKEGDIVDILESNEVFRASGDFRSFFKSSIKNARKYKHDIVISFDNKIKTIELDRED